MDLDRQAELNAERLKEIWQKVYGSCLTSTTRKSSDSLQTLGASGKGPASKRANIERIFKSIIKSDDDCQRNYSAQFGTAL